MNPWIIGILATPFVVSTVFGLALLALSLVDKYSERRRYQHAATIREAHIEQLAQQWEAVLGLPAESDEVRNHRENVGGTQ